MAEVRARACPPFCLCVYFCMSETVDRLTVKNEGESEGERGKVFDKSWKKGPVSETPPTYMSCT